MTKEELTLEVIRRLKSAYPLAECTLDYDQALKNRRKSGRWRSSSA